MPVALAGQHHPPPPPGSMASAPQDFGPFVNQAGGPQQHRRGPPAFAPAPPILSGPQGSNQTVEWSNQINPFLLQQQPPLPPREPSSSRDYYNEDEREESNRESRKDQFGRDKQCRDNRGRDQFGRDQRGGPRGRSRDRGMDPRGADSRGGGPRSRSRERKSGNNRQRSRSRDSKKRQRSRSREGRKSNNIRRSRSPRGDRKQRRSRSIERDRDRRERTPDSEEEGRNVPPNNTIMIRGLAQHITETDISDDIQSCGLVAKDIRLIRKKETGASRGFAFVEFTKIQDAQTWMDEKKVAFQTHFNQKNKSKPHRINQINGSMQIGDRLTVDS